MPRLTLRIGGILAAVATITAGSLLTVATPSAALAAPTDTGLNRSVVAALAKTPADTLCTGLWSTAQANVKYRRAPDGRLSWSFLLSNTSKLFLGPTVAVSMPFEYLNGQAINPPYQEHVEANTYDFHSSVNSVQFIGGGGRSITAGDWLTMYWVMYGTTTGELAYQYNTCKVPAPGAG